MDARLGKKGKDKITGFEGIITGACEYLYGCLQLSLSPPLTKEGKWEDNKWFDEGRIEIIGEGIVAAEVQSEKPGGEHDEHPLSDGSRRL